jgi:hypothetical protein
LPTVFERAEEALKMRKPAAATLLILFFSFLFLQGVVPGSDHGWGRARSNSESSAAPERDRPDIEWFKKEMGISPKYAEQESGVMGLSWAHFLTMVFLALSFVVALIALILRYRRTKDLLGLILKEGSQNDGKG